MTAETAQTTDCPLRDRHLRLALDFRELRPALPLETEEETSPMEDSLQLYRRGIKVQRPR